MGGLKSQQVGKSWEQELMDQYYKKGYQPFKLATEINGTCFDIIVIKNATVLCIEAKHITGKKLYFKGSGLSKKVDEINHFISHCNTNIYVFVKSDITGIWYNSWLKLYPILRSRGYVTKDDCISARLEEI